MEDLNSLIDTGLELIIIKRRQGASSSSDMSYIDALVLSSLCLVCRDLSCIT